MNAIEEKKSYQIIRFRCEKQQHYSVKDGFFVTSNSRFDGEFEATPTEARDLLKKLVAAQRKSNVCTMPQLMVVE